MPSREGKRRKLARADLKVRGHVDGRSYARKDASELRPRGPNDIFARGVPKCLPGHMFRRKGVARLGHRVPGEGRAYPLRAVFEAEENWTG
jgi:hypothetical protein